jgi:hypothetical protein
MSYAQEPQSIDKSFKISVLFGYSYGTTLALFVVESALDCSTRPAGRLHSGPKVNYEMLLRDDERHGQSHHNWRFDVGV